MKQSSMTHQDYLEWMENGLRITIAAVEHLPEQEQRYVAAGISSGGEFEVRLRLAPSIKPRISVFLIGDKGELELYTSVNGREQD